MTNQNLVSVIVPTKNSEATIGKCLASVRNQLHRNIEVIVVDNYSTDRTREIAARFQAKVHLKGPERSSQMNHGAKLARGDYVYFINSDFVLTRGLIRECIDLASSGCDAVIVWNVSDPRQGLWAKTRYYERLSYYGSNTYEAARFVRRDVFVKSGGFDEAISANEDISFGQKLARLATNVGRTKRNYELHVGEPKSLKEVVLKNYYYGEDFMNFLAKYKNYRSAVPIRPTFFRGDFVKKVWKEWPQGFILIPFLKLLQSCAILAGFITKTSISPYEHEQMRSASVR